MRRRTTRIKESPLTLAKRLSIEGIDQPELSKEYINEEIGKIFSLKL